LWQLNIGRREQKTIRAGSFDFAEKCIFPKLYFSAFFGLKDAQYGSQCQKQEIPFME
jgi:hypothetical protein